MKAMITVGYGAGFSEWNDPNLAIDQRIVHGFELKPNMSAEEFKTMCEFFGYKDVNVMQEDLEVMEVVEVPENVYFRIAAYDGWEYVEVFEPHKWFHS